jgi:hypothetical protein
MTCRAGTGFVFHSPDLSVCIGGYTFCLRCRGVISLDEYTAEQCPGSPTTSPDPAPAYPFRGVPCARCGDPVLVDPRHRATVDLFGTTCAACFSGMEIDTL